MSQILSNGEMLRSTMLACLLLALSSTVATAGQTQEELTDSMTQVTSVSQLADVKPTDWAFQALQSLVERYGCIAGYPNRTYHGDRALTRYEFAAGLNACLDRVNELIAPATTDLVKKEDLATLQKLQKEFATELVTLRGRADALETRTATLERQQFSTTTKLSGEVIFAITDGATRNRAIRNSNTTPGITLSGDVKTDDTAVNTTFVSRVRLNLSTSFTGRDLLFTQLQAGNGGLGAAVLGQDPGLGGNIRFNTFDLDYAGVGSAEAINYLFYLFSIGKDFQVSIGPVDAVNNYVDSNTYTNDEAQNFSSTFFKDNPLLFPVPTGALASMRWNPGGGAFGFHAVYVAGNAQLPSSISNSRQGVLGSPIQGTLELEFAPKRREQAGSFAIRLQYTTATVNDRSLNIGGVNAEWALNSKIGLFGRYGFGSIEARGSDRFEGLANTTFGGKTLNPSTWSAGISVSDLFLQGARGAIAVGQPFIESNVGNSTQTNVEAFYRIPINDNIAISPNLQFIFNPNNNADNSTITIGTIRTVFTF